MNSERMARPLRREAGGAREASVELRPMEAGDLDRVAVIENASFSNPWRRETFRRLLDRPATELWVASLPGVGVAGYCVLWWVLDEAELANVAVDAEHRRKGIGGTLVARARERAGARGARRLFLEVRASNENAVRLYRGRGFEVVGRRRAYYDRPREDALVMVKAID